MAIDSAYATTAKYRTVTKMRSSTASTETTPEDIQILADLKSVSRYLEGVLGRFLNADTADVTRIYVADEDSAKLRVDDLSAQPTSIIIDLDDDGTFASSDAFSTTDYELLPRNADKGPEPAPWNVIRLTPWGDRGAWGKDQRVQVTAKFGWPSVPEGVKRATIELTRILRMETPRATNQYAPVGDVGAVVSVSRPAQDIINRLVGDYGRERYG